MTGRPLLLGLDVGTSRTKAALVDGDGGEVALASAPTPFVTRDGDRVEMDVAALHRCLAGVLGRFDDDARRRVVGVGVAGMAESGAPFDTAGRALAPVIAWHDGRGGEAVALLQNRLGPGLARRTGQPARTVLTVAKLGWLVSHGMGAMVRWLGVPELGLHALTGAAATEFSLAARTGCYDVVAGRWIPEVADVLGFALDVFPAVRPAGTAMGEVSASGAAWSGLPAGIPVTVAGHDHLAGMAGAGVGRRQFANSVGTAETIVARCPTVPDVAAALDRRVAVSVHPGGKEWAALVSAARAGIVLESAAATLGRSPRDLDRLAEGAVAADVGDAVDALAAGAPAALPDASPGEVWAGLLGALADRTAGGYGRLAGVAGPAEAVVVFGGGSVSGPWLRAKQDRLGVPVRPSPVASAVARGAAVHAGVAAGWWPSADGAPRPPGAGG